MSETAPVARARFWQRAFAFLIDCIIVSAVVGVIGITLAKLTDGQIRVEDALVKSDECTQLDRVPAGVRVPADFTVTHVARCTRSFIWIRHDWFLTVADVTRTRAAPAYTRTLRFPLDPAGRVTNPFYLDSLAGLLLIAYLFTQEWRHGASAGKRALGLRVQSLSGQPPDLMQVSKRLLRFAPAPVLYLGQLSGDVALFWYFWSVSLVLALVFLANFIIATRRGDLPWHDRWAGTEVVRVTPPDAPSGAANAA